MAWNVEGIPVLYLSDGKGMSYVPLVVGVH